MSLNTGAMYQTMAEMDLLEEFDRLETAGQQMVVDFADLVHSSYHRGCRRQWIRCVVRYMYHHQKTYEEAAKVFEDILLDRKGIEEAVEKYYRVYSVMRENLQHPELGDP